MPRSRTPSSPAPTWLRQGVPATARRSVFDIHDRVHQHPEYKEQVLQSLSTNHPGNEEGVFTWGTYLNAGRNVSPVAIAALPDGLFILDALSAEEKLGIPWDRMIRCDLRFSDDIATVGMSWYDGAQEITERFQSRRMLSGEELSGGYFFVLNPQIGAERDPTPSNTYVFQWIAGAIGEMGIPEFAHRVPKLI